MAMTTEFKKRTYELSSLQMQLRDELCKWLDSGHTIAEINQQANSLGIAGLNSENGPIRKFLAKKAAIVGVKSLSALQECAKLLPGLIDRIILLVKDDQKDPRLGLCILEQEALDVFFDLHLARELSRLNVNEFSELFGKQKDIVAGALICAAQKAIGLNELKNRTEIFEILASQSWSELGENSSSRKKTAKKSSKKKIRQAPIKKTTGENQRFEIQKRYVQLVDELSRICGNRRKAFEAAGLPKTSAYSSYTHGGATESMLEMIGKLEKILNSLRGGQKTQVHNSSKPEEPIQEQPQPKTRRPSTGTIRTVNAIELSGKDALDGTHYVLTEDSFKSFQISCEASAQTILGALVHHLAATRGMLNVVIQLKKSGSLKNDEIIRKLGREVKALYESIELFESEFPVGLAKIFDQQRQFRKGR